MNIGPYEYHNWVPFVKGTILQVKMPGAAMWHTEISGTDALFGRLTISDGPLEWSPRASSFSVPGFRPLAFVDALEEVGLIMTLETEKERVIAEDESRWLVPGVLGFLGEPYYSRFPREYLMPMYQVRTMRTIYLK